MPRKSAHLMIFRPAALLVILVALKLAVTSAVGGEQFVIPRVQRMPRLPEPLVVRDWPQVAKQYYELLLDPATRITSNTASLSIIKCVDFFGMVDSQVRVIFSRSEKQIGSLDSCFCRFSRGVL